MKKFLIFLFAIIMMAGAYAFSATYNISPRGQYNTQPTGCDIPPYSTTVSPYTANPNCVPQNQPQILQGQYFNQNRQFTGQANTLGELPLGAIVMDPNSVWNFRNGGNYTGEISAQHPVLWKKLQDNHYAQGTSLLLSEVSIAHYPYCHENKGLRAWDESDVRRFLRTTFYNHLSTGFKNAIVNVSIPFADMQGNLKTINDNLFLLSIVEWGLSDRMNNGNAINFYDMPNTYGAFDNFRYANNTFNMEKNNYLNWTRTINKPKADGAGYNKDVFTIFKGGVLDTTESYRPQIVRPAVNLKSSTRIAGPYQFIYNSGQDSIIYYVLDFNQNQGVQYQQPASRGY